MLTTCLPAQTPARNVGAARVLESDVEKSGATEEVGASWRRQSRMQASSLGDRYAVFWTLGVKGAAHRAGAETN